ncbi:GNAT family N-acetyltransferase [Alkalihalobacillus sp. AL-G]|uniref:GNAT family N-acetyltransferase n=1 Tax=Alkalihalobacillus sp. AL-G TaxID=2926399 RepID=UPI00272A77BB|nr:GNAT family N-acetyltransferase [Alkalihalobacillus sp. AL-G]WLD94694.1 GNAT family N-acetyltransferase [Alkalihalobacillus sp. AL-G]
MLTDSQLKDIEELQGVCEAKDQIQLKLNWEMLHNRDKEERNDFLHYEDGELVAFLGLYGFGNKAELCGMVRPEFRRKGVFTKLFKKAIEEIRERNYSNVLLNAPADSQSAKGFLETIPCDYSISEYQMKWSETDLAVDESVKLRHSTPDDLEAEIQLDVRCFGFDVEGADGFNNRIKHEPSQKRYMIESEGKTVGKIRISNLNEEAWIYGFAIFPEFQGKGIGRKVLKKIIIEEHRNGYPVFLEVEAKNAHALGLYESCGFKTFHTQDYYQYKLL